MGLFVIRYALLGLLVFGAAGCGGDSTPVAAAGATGSGTAILKTNWSSSDGAVGFNCGSGTIENSMTITNTGAGSLAVLGTISVSNLFDVNIGSTPVSSLFTSLGGTCVTGKALSNGDSCTLTVSPTTGCTAGSFSDAGVLAISYSDGVGQKIVQDNLGVAFTLPWNCGVCISDARMKKDIHDLPYGLAEISKLRPVSFKYNGLGGMAESKEPQFGLIAQEVESVIPALVGKTKVKMHPEDQQETEIRYVNYGALPVMLLNSIKQLQKENSELKTRLDRLEAKRSEFERVGQK